MGNNLIIRFALLLLLAFSTGPARSAEPMEWPTVAYTEVVSRRFISPTAIAHAGDGSQRLFVAERTGRVWIINDGHVLPEPFLDLSSQVATTGPEQGLLGLAFPPNFRESGRFYVFYAAEQTPPFQTVQRSVLISRFQISFDPNRASVRSEEALLRLDAEIDLHNGGQLAFGPDGFLYIGVGDGGPLDYNTGHRAQNLNSLFGKILRIDVESQATGYAIPVTNPFRNRNDARAEIWAYGLRNPWRFSFDRATGDLYIGDVGQQHVEEVNFQPALSPGGNNYGWRILEGFRHNNVPVGYNDFDLTPPILTYDHAPLGGDGGQGSVTGGYVYRGPNPGRLAGTYVYGDFMAGYIWGLRRENGQWRTNALRTPLDAPLIMMSTFGEDEAGRLYMADYNRGLIYQLADSGQVWTPEFTPREGNIPSDQLQITSQTPNATIRYTTDGSEPTEFSPIVAADSQVRISDGATVKAKAFRNGLAPSAVRTATFRMRIGAPIFTPRDYETVPLNSLLTIRSETPNATILYTTTGTWPTNEPPLTYTGPLVITKDTLVLAKAVAPGYGESPLKSANIFVRKTARPQFDPTENWVALGTQVSITCSTPGARIYYSTAPDSNPDSWQRYSLPLTVNGRMTVHAYAEADGDPRSEFHGATFYPLTARPVFDPPAGTAFAREFTISCATPGATIHYTLDPYGNSQWTRYTGPVPITDGVSVRARATSPLAEGAGEQDSYYPWPRVGALYFDPPVGPVTNATPVAITSPFGEPGLVIRYTLDGTEPNAESPIYTEPLRITPPVTLKAAGEAPGFLPGYPRNITSVRYGPIHFENTFVTTYAGSTMSGSADGPRLQATFSAPSAVCIDTAGNLYVLDDGNGLVRKISATGDVTTIGSGIGYNASGICADPQGNVYVADPWNCNRIMKIAPDLTMSVFAEVSYCRPGYGAPFRIGRMSYGTDGLYVGAERAVLRVTASSVTTVAAGSEAGGWAWWTAPALDSANNLFIATGSSVFSRIYAVGASFSGKREKLSG